MRWRFNAIVLLLFTSSFVLSNLGVAYSAGGSIDVHAVLRIAVVQDLDGLNPLDSYGPGRVEDFILGLFFSSLFTYNPLRYYSAEYYLPWAVDSYIYTVEENTSRWVIKLRDDIYFSDGTPVTAYDLAFTYRFLKWLGSENDRFYDLYWIDFNVTVVDNLTVRIDLGTSAILPSIWSVSVWIFPQKIYGSAETWDRPGDNRTLVGMFPNWNVTEIDVVDYRAMTLSDPILLGSGPFRPAPGMNQTLDNPSVLVLERNPYYFRKAVDDRGEILHPWVNWSEMDPDNPELFGPYVERIELIFFDDLESAFDALRRGDVDLIGFYSNKTMAEAVAREGFRVVEGDFLFVKGLFFRYAALNWSLSYDRRFRWSIAYILNKTAIAEAQEHYEAIPTDFFVPPQYGDWSPKYDGPSFLDSNLTMAYALLAELNISDYDGDGFLEWNASDNSSEVKLSIGVYTESDLDFVNRTIASQLRAAGIKVNVVQINIETLCWVEYDMMYIWAPIGVPPIDIFARINIISLIEDSKNDTFDSVVSSFFEARNWSELKERVHLAERIARQEQIFIPIYTIRIFGTYKSNGAVRIEGVYLMPNYGLLNFYTALRTIKYGELQSVQNNTQNDAHASENSASSSGDMSYSSELVYAGWGIAIILVIAVIGVVLSRRRT